VPHQHTSISTASDVLARSEDIPAALSAGMADAFPASAERFCATRYGAYVLACLFLANVFNLMDRMILGVVQEPVKAEFHLSDLQLGLLGGPTFAILYSLLGIPIAHAAEKHNRARIIAFCLALWSVMTASCGFATSYLQLLLARVGVGIGEAGCTPPAHSLIADHFALKQRTYALAIYSVGGPVGSLLAAILGGWIAQSMGWRSTFHFLGMAGVALAIIYAFTLYDRRSPPAPAERYRLVDVLKVLIRKRTLVHVSAGGAITGFGSYAIAQYMTSFYVRSHHLPLAQGALLTGIAFGIFGGLGTYFSGFLVHKVNARWEKALVGVPAICFVCATPLYCVGFSVSSVTIAMWSLFLATFFMNCSLGQSYAVAQGVAPPRMRATSSALFLLAVNIFGLTLGPPALGALSDSFARHFSDRGSAANACATALNAIPCAYAVEEGLRWALVIWSFAFLWAAFHYARASRTLRQDLVG
jgi:predicted MFS family arabinose efflux permease